MPGPTAYQMSLTVRGASDLALGLIAAARYPSFTPAREVDMFERLHQYFPLGDAVNAAVRLLIGHSDGLFDNA